MATLIEKFLWFRNKKGLNASNSGRAAVRDRVGYHGTGPENIASIESTGLRSYPSQISSGGGRVVGSHEGTGHDPDEGVYMARYEDPRIPLDIRSKNTHRNPKDTAGVFAGYHGKVGAVYRIKLSRRQAAKTTTDLIHTAIPGYDKVGNDNLRFQAAYYQGKNHSHIPRTQIRRIK